MRRQRQRRRRNGDDAERSAGRRRPRSRSNVAPTTPDAATILHLVLGHLCAGTAIVVRLHPNNTAPTKCQIATTHRTVDTGEHTTIIALTVTVPDHPIDVNLKDTHGYHPVDPPPITINMMKTSVRVSVLETVSGGTVTRGKRRMEVGRGVENEQ
jgi:hypothetical protein